MRQVSVEAADLKKGSIIDYKGAKYQVMKTAANVTNRKAFALLDLRDMVKGSTVQEKMRSDQKVNQIFVKKVKVVLLYEESDVTVFQDPKTFDTINVPKSVTQPYEKFLSEGVEGSLLMDENENVLTFSPPSKVTATVVRMNNRIAVTDIGVQCQVPPFIKVGDAIEVDVEDTKYLGRPS